MFLNCVLMRISEFKAMLFSTFIKYFAQVIIYLSLIYVYETESHK